MITSTRQLGRSAGVAVKAMVLATVLGVGYTLAITVVAQALLPAQANGSLLRNGAGDVVGSSLIGQPFADDDDGAPRPEYFQPRPSAAGDGYDGGASSGSNLGPENDDLIAAIAERRSQVASLNRVPEADVPADALTASGSGLDPHISPEYAAIQVDRIAAERGIPPEQVSDLVRSHTQGPDLGYLGEPVVNVLELNVALDEAGD
ncbi:potassium-transporting ATPase subunit KdpC [Microbacterium sp. 179-B 1A2 NHS]|uniref:potassium-transporting ATPase subunit KdpC n=1 Tax=Microbacterium sp. 179-B 1A2 NHS TaxID=3142383 RepID=UPI0039A188CA